MFVVEYPNLRVAADLANTLVYTSPAMPCLGARSVAFYAKATNANASPVDAAHGAQASLDGGVTWMTVAVSADFLTSRGNIQNTDMTTGRCLSVCSRDNSGASGPYPFICATHVRITILGHATLTIAGLSVIGRVFYDSDGLRVQPSPVPAA